MRKTYSCLISLFLLAPALAALAACGRSYDYAKHISELRSDIFCAETEEFTLSLSCVSREYPYASDGVACPRSDVIEISLVPLSVTAEEYSVYLLDQNVGGEMSFRNYAGDWFFSQSVESFPEQTVSLRVERGETAYEITATTVKNDETISPDEALGFAVRAEADLLGRMTSNGVFRGEFSVRLLRRDKNYYFVGIVTDGGNVSLLLDGESGEILARREN